MENQNTVNHILLIKM